MLQAIRTKAGGIVVKVTVRPVDPVFRVLGPLHPLAVLPGQIARDRASPRSAARPSAPNELQQALEPALERLRTQLGGTIDRDAGEAARRPRHAPRRARSTARCWTRKSNGCTSTVSDDVVRNTIAGNPAFRGPDGRFNRDQFQQILAMNHLDRGPVRRPHAQRHPAHRHPARRHGRRHCRRARRSTRSIATATRRASPTSSPADLGRRRRSRRRATPSCRNSTTRHQDLFRAPEYRGFTHGQPQRRRSGEGHPDPGRQAQIRVRPAQGRFRRPRAARGAADPGALPKTRPRRPRRRWPPARTSKRSPPRSPGRLPTRSISA